MKQQLTLEHIAWYLPGLKFDTPDGIRDLIGYKHNTAYFENGFCEIPFRKEMPILLPMSDLTKPFVKDGVETTHLTELAKLSCPFITHGYEIGEESDGTLWCNLENENGSVVTWCLEYNLFHNSFMTHESTQYKGKCDQITLFKYLAKHKFDFNGLIESGLAIDVNTLENNVYN